MKPYYQDGYVTIYHGDCREILPSLPKVDLVLTDPPYGITACDWDTAAGATSHYAVGDCLVLTAVMPFTAALCDNTPGFRHHYVWVKNRGSNFLNAGKTGPMREHEDILVFGGTVYNPQRIERATGGASRVQHKINPSNTGKRDCYGGIDAIERENSGDRCPSSVLYYETEVGKHPTQKPLGLFKLLALTYSNEGNTILDPFAGSGTTGRAAKDLQRKCICIEIEERYCEIGAKRMAQEVLPL